MTGPLRFSVQFSVQEEFVQLVERAKALLSHAHSKSSLEEVHLRAMRLLVAELEKQRFGAKPRPRKVPAATRRSVDERDGGRCSYVDVTGERCRETHRLELHHLKAFARGGTHEAENVTLRCRAHNVLAAEQDFGRACVERAGSSQRHESLVSQVRDEARPGGSRDRAGDRDRGRPAAEEVSRAAPGFREPGGAGISWARAAPGFREPGCAGIS